MSVVAVHPLNDKSINITTALEFGDVKYVNSRYVYADEIENEEIPQAVYDKMLRSVDEFDPESDYLLIAGDHLQMMAMSALLAARWGRFRVLRYDRQAGGYVVVALDTGGVIEAWE